MKWHHEKLKVESRQIQFEITTQIPELQTFSLDFFFFFLQKRTILITYKYNSLHIHTETETEKVAQWLT